jgi:hypothetical protein
LQALIVCGTELPPFSKLFVKINIGLFDITSKPVSVNGGLCRWNEFVLNEKLLLPQDTSQLPDLFIYLVNNDLKPICFKVCVLIFSISFYITLSNFFK